MNGLLTSLLKRIMAIQQKSITLVFPAASGDMLVPNLWPTSQQLYDRENIIRFSWSFKKKNMILKG